MIKMHWTEDLFIKNVKLFKILLDLKWKYAERDSRIISSAIEEFCKDCKLILDVMCGNGRIALHLAKYEYEVICIDFSEELLRDGMERAKDLGVYDKVKFVKRDVREPLNLDVIGDAALLIWSSIGYYSLEEDIEILRNIRDYVRENGLLIIADIILKSDILLDESQSYFEIDRYKIFLHSIYDRKSSILRNEWFFYENLGGREKYIGETEMLIRIYDLSELQEMLEKAGWKPIAIRCKEGMKLIIAKNVL